MSDFDPSQVLTRVFHRLRQNGFVLGVGELLAALDAVEGGWGTEDLGALKQVARLLWCRSPLEARELDALWAEVLMAPTRQEKPPSVPPSLLPPSASASGKGERAPGTRLSAPPPRMQKETATQSDVTALPVRAPDYPAAEDETRELSVYWPVSRRFMAYAWRYLRRPLPDGPDDILDITATVDRTALQGFFLGPVYRRRERNHAHLLLLIDQGGSMVPFHRFTRDLVETAQQESDIAQVDVFYFHNIVAGSVYRDVYMLESVILDQALANCDADSSLLVVSDAGAARGVQRRERIRATTQFLLRLKRRTTLLAWLNPMPMTRWPGTSAQIIAHLTPMFQMDPDGFSNAIDVIRGQPRL